MNSGQLYARAAGVLYLTEIALAFAVNPIWDKVPMASNVYMMAAQISAPLSQWRVALVGEVLTYMCYAAIAVLFYALLRPVDRILALLSSVLMLVHVAVAGTSTLGRAAVLLLSARRNVTVFDPHHLQGITRIALNLHDYGHNIGLFFFAGHCIVLGYLIYRSAYLPKVFGVLFPLTSLLLLTSILANFLVPDISAAIFPALIAPFFLTQLSFALWLTIFGVNVHKWPSEL